MNVTITLHFCIQTSVVLALSMNFVKQQEIIIMVIPQFSFFFFFGLLALFLNCINLI